MLLSSAARNAAGVPSNKKLVDAGRRTLTASGVIDLNDNDMLIHDTTAGVRSTRPSSRPPATAACGISPASRRTAAKNSVPKNKSLAVISGTEFHAAQRRAATFDGRTVVATDTLIKFTFNGDTDLNGSVELRRLRPDRQRLQQPSHRLVQRRLRLQRHGRLRRLCPDRPGVQHARSAVTLSTIDGGLAGPGARTIVSAAMNTLGMVGTDATMVMRPTQGQEVALTPQGSSSVGNLSSVPEPTMLSVIGVGLLGALRRRRSAR